MKLNVRSFVASLLFAGGLAHASILPPTGSAPVPPDVFTTPGGGPFLASTGTLPFVAENSLGQVTISGTYSAQVYADPNNVFCAGCLDFLFEITSSATSTDGIARITDTSFSTYLTDVGYSTGTGSVPGGVYPVTVDRSSNGAVIGFNFELPAGIAPGDSTEILEIETNATTYMPGSLQITDGGVATVVAFAPDAAPEATTVSMMLMGAILFGVAFLTHRRTAAR
ncbi:MAG: hypothetical protein ABSH32_16065 [Bryobacteraceae bacterium]|jgi:hypothetical protein